MKEQLEYYSLKIFLWLAKFLPRGVLEAFTIVIAWLLFHLDRKRRQIAIENIKRSLGLQEQEAKALAWQNYKELAKTLTQILLHFNGRFDLEAIDKSELAKLKNLKAPIIFITAHIGNWELLAQLLAKEGYPMGVVGRAGNNWLIENRITAPFRNRYGNWLIHKHKAAKELIKTLRAGKNVGLLLDQRGGQAGIWVEFFGRKASTLPTAHVLQKRFNAPVVPIFLVHDSGRLRVRVFEPIEFIDDEVEHTRKINEAYERIIKAYPTQWFWMHERWRK